MDRGQGMGLAKSCYLVSLADGRGTAGGGVPS